MEKYLKIILLSLVCCWVNPLLSVAASAEKKDTLEVSLLTCAPGDAAYELYGHTALRVKNLTTGNDYVFNYGVFDFDTPHFAWRFMTGQTDYTIGVSRFSSFAYSYERRGRYVLEQKLRLKPEEKIRLFEALQEDWKQEHWTYRYNFIYDNCTTRAIDKIEQALNGIMVFPTTDGGGTTFREILHEFSEETSPWYSFGEDLVLGAEVDKPIDVRKKLFSPIYAERLMDGAYVQEPDGSRRYLVADKVMAVSAISTVSHPCIVSPLVAFSVLLLAVFAVSIWEFKRRRLCLGLDYTLMAVQGLAGCIVAFLFFGSLHPAVSSNWLLILLNPLPLFYLPVKIWRDRRHKKDGYYWVLAVALLAFGITALLELQKYPIEIYLVALILLLRVSMSYFINRKRK